MRSARNRGLLIPEPSWPLVRPIIVDLHMGTEEPDVNELIVEYLKSKSLFDTARKVKDDLLARSLTTGSTAATDLFTSELERKLGVAGRPRGATAAPLLISSPEIATPSTTHEDGMPSSEAPRLAARSRSERHLKLVQTILYSSELEASRLRIRHGSGDAKSRAIFHDPPRMTASEGEYTHFSHIVCNSRSDPPLFRCKCLQLPPSHRSTCRSSSIRAGTCFTLIQRKTIAGLPDDATFC